MRVACDRSELAERLQSVSGVVSAGATTKPILQDFHLRAAGDEVVAEVTDLDIAGRIRMRRVEVLEEGALALPASRLIALAREIPAARVHLESVAPGQAAENPDVAEEARSSASMAVLRAEGYEFRLLGDDPAEFPEVRPFAADSALQIPREKFVEMLRRVSVAACRDSARFQLTGVFVEIEDDRLTMTATDGKRLTHDYLRISNSNAVRVSGIIPNRAVDVLLKVLSEGDETIRLALLETEVQVDFGHGELIAKLIEGIFPDYRGAIPGEPKSRVTARRADLLTAVRSAALVTDKETSTINFDFTEDLLSLESRASDIGESRIQVPITLQGESLSIRFNPMFFLDALRAVNEDEVRMEFCGSGRPGAIRTAQHYRHLLMPLLIE